MSWLIATVWICHYEDLFTYFDLDYEVSNFGFWFRHEGAISGKWCCTRGRRGRKYYILARSFEPNLHFCGFAAVDFPGWHVKLLRPCFCHVIHDWINLWKIWHVSKFCIASQKGNVYSQSAWERYDIYLCDLIFEISCGYVFMLYCIYIWKIEWGIVTTHKTIQTL